MTPTRGGEWSRRGGAGRAELRTEGRGSRARTSRGPGGRPESQPGVVVAAVVVDVGGVAVPAVVIAVCPQPSVCLVNRPGEKLLS